MYQVGEKVCHLSYGICSVMDIRKEKFTDVSKLYYILHPIEDRSDSIVYVPVETMHPQIRTIYTPEQIEQFITEAQQETVEWSDNKNYRKAYFLDILKSGDTRKIIAMICCIYRKKEMLNEVGKKLHMTDEKILLEAQRKIEQEFAYSLQIQQSEVPEYIQNKIYGCNYNIV